MQVILLLGVLYPKLYPVSGTCIDSTTERKRNDGKPEETRKQLLSPVLRERRATPDLPQYLANPNSQGKEAPI